MGKEQFINLKKSEYLAAQDENLNTFASNCYDGGYIDGVNSLPKSENAGFTQEQMDEYAKNKISEALASDQILDDENIAALKIEKEKALQDAQIAAQAQYEEIQKQLEKALTDGKSSAALVKKFQESMNSLQIKLDDLKLAVGNIINQPEEPKPEEPKPEEQAQA